MPRWTPEARRKQAEIQKTRQSWRHATGPKTAAGKARASMNAWKHGLRSAPARRLRTILRRQSRLLKHINAYMYANRQRDRSRKDREEAQSTLSHFINNTFAPFAPPWRPLRERKQREPLYFLWAGAIKDACLPEQDKIRRSL